MINFGIKYQIYIKYKMYNIENILYFIFNIDIDHFFYFMY